MPALVEEGMTQYLLSVPHDSTTEPTMETMDPAELEAALAATGAIIEELQSTGAFVFAGGLMPPSSAVTVDNSGGELQTVNAPFVEAPEYVIAMDAQQEANLRIKQALESRGVGFAFPTRVVMNVAAD